MSKVIEDDDNSVMSEQSDSEVYPLSEEKLYQEICNNGLWTPLDDLILIMNFLHCRDPLQTLYCYENFQDKTIEEIKSRWLTIFTDQIFLSEAIDGISQIPFNMIWKELYTLPINSDEIDIIRNVKSTEIDVVERVQNEMMKNNTSFVPKRDGDWIMQKWEMMKKYHLLIDQEPIPHISELKKEIDTLDFQIDKCSPQVTLLHELIKKRTSDANGKISNYKAILVDSNKRRYEMTNDIIVFKLITSDIKSEKENCDCQEIDDIVMENIGPLFECNEDSIIGFVQHDMILDKFFCCNCHSTIMMYVDGRPLQHDQKCSFDLFADISICDLSFYFYSHMKS